MTKINENYRKLPGSYLFTEIARRVTAYGQKNPDKRLIRLGIRGCDPAAGPGGDLRHARGRRRDGHDGGLPGLRSGAGL